MRKMAGFRMLAGVLTVKSVLSVPGDISAAVQRYRVSQAQSSLLRTPAD